MNEQILVNVTPQETRVAITEQGVVQELHVERRSARGLVGNIYLGTVARVLPGMQSAFIDIGLERAAFLHIADIWSAREKGDNGTPIERILSDGQTVLVQVIKDPIGSKGARLSTQISMAGRLLVYLPQEAHIGISQRIEDEGERALLKEKLQQLLPDNEEGGFIIRTVAEFASDKELKDDIEYLTRLWTRIKESAKTAPPSTLIHQDLSLALRVVRDFVNEKTERILVDSRETFQSMREFAESYTHSAVPVLEPYTGERPLFDLFGVEDEIERALGAPRRSEIRRLFDYRSNRSADDS